MVLCYFCCAKKAQLPSVTFVARKKPNFLVLLLFKIEPGEIPVLLYSNKLFFSGKQLTAKFN